MNSVEDGSSTDLPDDTGLCDYKCNRCGNIFKGVRIGVKLKCPECSSEDTIITQGIEKMMMRTVDNK